MGVELLLQKVSGSASFAAKVVPSLNGLDPDFCELSFWIFLVEQSAKISYMLE
jgi:hypothetical protein